MLTSAIGLLASDGVAGFTARDVARAADTTPPAIYELFGDKRGLVREVFFAGFRRLGERLADVPVSADPRADLVALVGCYRRFVTENPVLAEVMLARPFSDFDPTRAELEASGSVRRIVLQRVRRCVDAGVLQGDATDIAHVLVALTQGMAAAENARRLGRTRASVERRWALALEATLDGLASTSRR